MTAWRLARSLDQLRTEINTRWPNRSKLSDGAIGDPSHAATASDHNPNPQDVVCALDITHDPTNGPDIETLGEQLRANPNPQCKYLIYNHKLASRFTSWQTRPYTGDPHTNHIHVSVGIGPDGKSRPPYDDRTPWLPPTPTPTPPPIPEEETMFVFQAAGQGGPMLMCGGRIYPILDGADTGHLCNICKQSAPIPISAATFNAWK